MALLFHSHPEWKPNGSAVDRKIKVNTLPVISQLSLQSIVTETSPTRDKHAHGIAERSVGNIVTKANVAMLGNINNQCQTWCAGPFWLGFTKSDVIGRSRDEIHMDHQDLLILTQSIDQFARIVVAIVTTRIKRVSALDWSSR